MANTDNFTTTLSDGTEVQIQVMPDESVVLVTNKGDDIAHGDSIADALFNVEDEISKSKTKR